MSRKTSLFAGLLVAAASTFALGASAQGGLPVKGGNWAGMVAETSGGHLLGNPKAETKLVEYMSYTCSHCASFSRTGDAALKLLYVPSGRMSFEIRHLVRDPVDLTAVLLTHCGEAKKFPGNHEAFMARHDAWMAKARKTTQAQRARWQFGSLGARFQAIASDLDFYDIMEGRGYSRVAADKCLADEAKANALAEGSRADIEAHGISGTPSFLLNGELLDGTHAWEDLQPQLDKAL